MLAHEAIASWLLAALGRKLLAVNALFHVFESQRNGMAQEIEFIFENLSGKLYCEKDGASIGYSNDPLVSCDLGVFGKQVVFPVSGEIEFSNVVGTELISAATVYSSVEQTVIGVLMNFDNNSKLSILNLGDDIYLYEYIPENIISEEGLEFIYVR